ncbi:MAG TPA: GGDEF domain-containing protein, partial [Thioalkalivibrio sp.]|nr:GGDEF domain-containing protein [Thioalkalivibrio sp.]
LLLNELTDNLHRSLNRSRLAYQALNTLVRHGLANGALLYLQDGSSETLELTAWQGVDDERIGEQASPVTLTHHMPEWDSGSPWLLGSCPAPGQVRLRTTLARLNARDAAVIPLGFMGRRLGALELLYHEAREFSTVELDTLRAVGRTLSLALMNADHFTEIEYQALHDPLTGLPNRKRFHRDARQVLTGDAPMALLLLDLNRFGEINNTLGHRTGDELLRGVAGRLRECLAESALLSRLSADEFAILLPVEDADGEEWLGRTTRMILTAVGQPFQLQGMGLEVNASIGISLCPQHSRDSHALLRCADVALQQAKQGSGSEPTRVYEPGFDEQNPLRLAMMTDLTTAIRQDQLSLCFQSKIHLDDGRLSGMEALIRWQHPELGHISPGQFIPLVEMTELIRPLTFWVLDKTLQYLRSWRRLGLDVPVAVNLSARVLTDLTLPEYLGSMLRRYEVPASMLELEITESALMADPEKALAIARQLATLGVKLSIDDFGTGYSSLSYLKRLPLTALKIDRSFVAEMFDSENDGIIVRSTIGLAHSLGLRVVAEGIEDDATLNALREMGCDEGQGFGIGRPEPAAAIQARLSSTGDCLPPETR